LAEKLIDNDRLNADCVEVMHLADGHHGFEHAIRPLACPGQADLEPCRRNDEIIATWANIAVRGRSSDAAGIIMMRAVFDWALGLCA